MDLIYCVEDDEGIRDLITYAVKSAGFEAEGFESASDFEKRLGERLPSMVLLDIMLPDKDGIAILKDIRNNDTTKNVPVIMITAKGTESDKVKGFEYGADDYITKPFDIREVILRVKSILRRIERTRNGEGEGGILRVADVAVDLDRHEVYKGERRVELTPKEFALLEILMRSPGRVFKRGELLEKVWEFEYMGDTRTVDIHIQRLRKKLQDDRFIRTVFGVGYKVAEEEAQ